MNRALQLAREQRDKALLQRDEARQELDDRNRQLSTLTALVFAPIDEMESVSG